MLVVDEVVTPRRQSALRSHFDRTLLLQRDSGIDEAHSAEEGLLMNSMGGRGFERDDCDDRSRGKRATDRQLGITAK